MAPTDILGDQAGSTQHMAQENRLRKTGTPAALQVTWWWYCLLSHLPRPPCLAGDPVVVIAERLDGSEDIPEGVTAVITAAATDVLSHVAIRARAQKVLLASCFDAEAMKEMRCVCVCVCVLGGGGAELSAEGAAGCLLWHRGQKRGTVWQGGWGGGAGAVNEVGGSGGSGASGVVVSF